MTSQPNFAADNYVGQAIAEFAASIGAATEAERPAVLAEAVSTLKYVNASRLRDDQITAALKDAPRVDGRDVLWAATLQLRPNPQSTEQQQFSATEKQRPCELAGSGTFRAGRCEPIENCLCRRAGWT